jgi:hypothetical protein
MLAVSRYVPMTFVPSSSSRLTVSNCRHDVLERKSAEPNE